jgi:hypothetical protein
MVPAAVGLLLWCAMTTAHQQQQKEIWQLPEDETQSWVVELKV